MSLAEVANEFAARYDRRRTNFGNHKFMQTFLLRKLANTALMMYLSLGKNRRIYRNRVGGRQNLGTHKLKFLTEPLLVVSL